MVHEVKSRPGDANGFLHRLRLHQDGVHLGTLPLEAILPCGHDDRLEEVVIVQRAVRRTEAPLFVVVVVVRAIAVSRDTAHGHHDVVEDHHLIPWYHHSDLRDRGGVEGCLGNGDRYHCTHTLNKTDTNTADKTLRP